MHKPQITTTKNDDWLDDSDIKQRRLDLFPGLSKKDDFHRVSRLLMEDEDIKEKEDKAFDTMHQLEGLLVKSKNKETVGSRIDKEATGHLDNNRKNKSRFDVAGGDQSENSERRANRQQRDLYENKSLRNGGEREDEHQDHDRYGDKRDTRDKKRRTRSQSKDRNNIDNRRNGHGQSKDDTPQLYKIYPATVSSIKQFGAFVSITETLKKAEGTCYLSNQTLQ